MVTENVGTVVQIIGPVIDIRLREESFLRYTMQ